MLQRKPGLEPFRAFVRRTRAAPHTAVGVVAVALVVVLAADAIVPGPRPSPEGTGAVPTRGGPTSTARPEPSAAPWTRLEVPDFIPLADLSPIQSDASGVDVRSAFVLRSRTTTPALAMASGLRIEPAIRFVAEPGGSSSEARITPTEPLQPGIRYRFRAMDPTGRLIGTWSYRTAGPLHVVGLLPDDRSTSVPVSTGIEVTFDQDGPTDIASHFSIDPPVAGTIQAVGRTIVFAPTKPLAMSTIYHVTVAAGVRMMGSDQTLEAPVSWAFETSGPDTADSWDVTFGRPLLEFTPREPAVIGLNFASSDGTVAFGQLPVRVYRVPTFASARDVANALLIDPGWAQVDRSTLVPTAGLTKVLDFSAVPEFQASAGFSVIRLPAPLAAGWYLLVIPRDGRDRQALLQITDLAAWVMTSETRTVGWVHDLETGRAVANVDLLDASGARLGATDAQGLLNLATPPTLRPAVSDDSGARPTIAAMTAPDGRRLLVALGAPTLGGGYLSERSNLNQWSHPAGDWWSIVATDRSVYRTSDLVHVWGVLRSRDTGLVPDKLSVRLRASASTEEHGPWLATATVRPNPRGTWTADLAISDLQYGDYIVDIQTIDGVIASTWIGVHDIRKPAYSLDVTVDRHAVFAGDPVTFTAHANFFDGTSAAGLNLVANGFGASSTVRTDASGKAAKTVLAATSTTMGYGYESVDVRPARPEEGQISGSTSAIVFPSGAWFDVSATISGTRAVLSGTLSRVDLAAVEQQLLTVGWPENPAGAPLGGRSVKVTLNELVPVTRQVGTTYDFIEKRVMPILETTTTEHRVGIYTTTSGADGAIALSIPVPNVEHTYRLSLTTTDSTGRVARIETYASKAGTSESPPATHPYLDKGGGCGYANRAVPIGDNIAVTLFEGDGRPGVEGEYLFLVAARGIRDVLVQTGSTLDRTFTAADLPSLNVMAVRFGAGGYLVTNEVLIRADAESRTLKVELTAGRARYAPGETATVMIRTTDSNGAPVSTDIVTRGTDEKLTQIGAANDIDALATLLNPVSDGLLQSATTHVLPGSDLNDGCGDTGGGGRDDFRDSAVFRLASTDADGLATVSFPLPDDITSWHISATAIDDELRAGDGFVLLPVGLPFFVDAILAPEFLVGDKPVLQIRAAGDQLTAGATVQYAISAPSLLLGPTVIQASGTATARLTLPGLPIGAHDITIQASVVGDASLHDTLVRRVVVRESRIEVRNSATVAASDAANVGGSGLTSYVVTDAGRGALLPIVSSMAEGQGARFDRALSAEIARSLLIDVYGFDPATLPASTFDVSRWDRDGIALLPYSSPDLDLTALTAIVAPSALDTATMDERLRAWADEDGTTRERRIIALAGRAGLGSDVLDALRVFDGLSLTTRESLWLALGHLASGDEGTARTIEASMLRAHGEQLGPWVRLRVGATPADATEATALVALVAAGIGDPLAPRLVRYLVDNPEPTYLPVLHEAGAIRWVLERLPRDPARFAWTVDGVRNEELLEPGGSRTITVTAGQRAGLSIAAMQGDVVVVATWAAPPTATDLPSSDLVTIRRVVTPDGSAGSTDIVRVRLELSFGPQALLGCYDVTDTTPSGLAPLVWTPGWDGPANGDGAVWYPWAVDGQRVSWCIDPLQSRRPVLTYSARVVSPGTYRWEPAIVQMAAAPEIGAATASTSYTIR